MRYGGGMHILVTGASSGIGEAIAKAFLAAGHEVTMVARRQDRLAATASIAPSRSNIIVKDLADFGPGQRDTDGTGCAELVAEASAHFGPIDVLVNNAGVQVVDNLVNTSIADAERMLRLNLFVPLRLTKAVLPQMIAQGRGTIVDIASVNGRSISTKNDLIGRGGDNLRRQHGRA
jgi:NADP-dependent 3-hydroxy acid dehydrogenase YdfG